MRLYYLSRIRAPIPYEVSVVLSYVSAPYTAPWSVVGHTQSRTPLANMTYLSAKHAPRGRVRTQACIHMFGHACPPKCSHRTGRAIVSSSAVRREAWLVVLLALVAVAVALAWHTAAVLVQVLGRGVRVARARLPVAADTAAGRARMDSRVTVSHPMIWRPEAA